MKGPVEGVIKTDTILMQGNNFLEKNVPSKKFQNCLFELKCDS